MTLSSNQGAHPKCLVRIDLGTSTRAVELEELEVQPVDDNPGGTQPTAASPLRGQLAWVVSCAEAVLLAHPQRAQQ